MSSLISTQKTGSSAKPRHRYQERQRGRWRQAPPLHSGDHRGKLDDLPHLAQTACDTRELVSPAPTMQRCGACLHLPLCRHFHPLLPLFSLSHFLSLAASIPPENFAYVNDIARQERHYW